jgi:hypothetical protein
MYSEANNKMKLLDHPTQAVAPPTVDPKTVDQPSLITQLREQIRQTETAGRIGDGSLVTNGCHAIDRLLPENGYPRGSLIQWISTGGSGADLLSLRVAQQACDDGGALVVIDPQHEFFPPAAAAIGINLDNLIVLRGNQLTNCQGELPISRQSTDDRSSVISAARSSSPTLPSTSNATNSVTYNDTYNNLLWSIDQSLRCPAVAAVWGSLNEINERWFRRFQLSAESSGCMGLFVQPAAAARQPTWAEVQWMVGTNSPAKKTGFKTDDSHHSQLVRLQLTRCRGTHTGKVITLAINHITGKVQQARRDHEQQHKQQRLRDRFRQQPIRGNSA